MAENKQLKQYIERIERLENEKSETTACIREIYAEAKSAGFEPKIMRQILKMKKKRQDELEKEEMLLQAYMEGLGMTS